MTTGKAVGLTDCEPLKASDSRCALNPRKYVECVAKRFRKLRLLVWWRKIASKLILID